MEYLAEKIDVAVIGAGHAGCEAAFAAARLGMKTYLFTISLDAIANMPCNPNVGGTAKGHLVREVDALGGEMGKVIDQTFIQSRMLNKGKGPAVHSLRAQADRREYQKEMKRRLEKCDNLFVKQAEIVNLRKCEEGWEVVTHLGALFCAKAVILATGTYLKGKIIIGDTSYEGGPDGLFPANRLSDALLRLNVPLMRFKTGTPARVNARSVDTSVMEPQEGDEKIVPFSFTTDPKTLKNKVRCYLTYTNETTHQIIRDNLHRSPLYSGRIEGVGPRYCPSIEDKVVRFADKERHQIFMEPMGLSTSEMYVQGMSSSLPEDVQIKMLRSVKGLENVEMMRTAYAIEYDCVDPTALYASLEFKDLPGLYGAGQFNGSSGYEEAACQGLMAGINAARKIRGEEPFTLDRSEAYIGVLIDDLVTKGTKEPYRMLTSRSEYRLLLRQDNADLRLTPLGHDIGLIDDDRYRSFCEKRELIQKEIKRVENTNIPPSKELNEILEKAGSTPVSTGIKLGALLRRPEMDYEMLSPVDPKREALPDAVAEQVEISIKYDGYIKMQMEQVEAFRKNEKIRLPEDLDYTSVKGLRLEAAQKLEKMRPQNLGQASRISGVSPADIGVLLIYLKK